MGKNISRRKFLETITLGGSAVLLASCAARPYAGAGQYAIHDQKLKLDEINEKNSRFYVKGVSIFGQNFYHVITPIGNALFKDSKSLEKTVYKVNEKGKIKGSTSIESGEGGLFFIDHARDNKEKMIDQIYISPLHKKAIMSNPKIIQQKQDWKLFNRIEQDSKFKMGTGYLSGKPYIAVKVEDKEIDLNEKKFYNFYLIPVDGLDLYKNKQGHLRIRNDDNIFRPKFAPWQVIREMVEERKPKLSKKEQKITKKILEKVGLKAIKTKNTTKK